MTAVINLPWLGSPTDELWEELLILSAKTKRVPWMLIGGQMMLLHTLEHGREPLQVSQDGDAIADIRARPDALLAFVRALESEDFESDGMSPDGRAHRYKHKTFDPPVLVDVLAPDNVGPRANLTTTPPGRTVEVPGGTQALHRVEEVEVVLASGSKGLVPRPDLLGAIVIKAGATTLAERRDRHFNDLALMAHLLGPPAASPAGDVAGECLLLLFQLAHPCLHDIADAHQPAQLPLDDDREVSGPALGHHAHDLVELVAGQSRRDVP